MTENAQPEPREVSPFKIINRGEDTVDKNDRVVFADFSPKVVPSETPDREKSPKGASAPRPARSKESPPKTEQKKSETSAQTPASKDAGAANPSGTSK